ncbi:hypothetical protein [Methanococcoides sp. AM1]|uniref:hypothetical protein n=1 Tax=Methanococcoides sp. AM1 TaxID=1201011 RepID=UPI00108363A5|nr:hypothetical protein [Methanococcoides sp. AM1]
MVKKFKGIQFFEKPRHGSVKRAQNVVRDWQLQNLPMKDMDPQKGVDDAIGDFLKENGEYLARFINFQESAQDYQTVMLATTLTLRDIQSLEDEISHEEWEELLGKCKDTIGGDAVDFFRESPTDSSSIMEVTDTATVNESST